MDLNRLQKLAGMPLMEANSLIQKTEIHVSTAPHTSGGVLGDLVNILDGKTADALAEILEIPTGWKKVKIGKCYAAYMKGSQLCFFNNEDDFMPDLYD